MSGKICDVSVQLETIFMHRVSNFDDREIDFKADSSDIHKIFATAKSVFYEKVLKLKYRENAFLFDQNDK